MRLKGHRNEEKGSKGRGAADGMRVSRENTCVCVVVAWGEKATLLIWQQ